MKTRRDSELETSMPAGGRGNSLEMALDASELRYRRLFETAQDGILILEAATGNIIDANPFLLDLLDYPFESIIGLHLWEIGQFKDIAANHEAFERLQTNEYIRYENLPLRTKSGQEIQVEFVSNAYFVGADKVIQCNIRDISVRSQAEAASQMALEIAAKARSDVLAVLAHELRNPLAAISAATDLIELERNVTHALAITEALSDLAAPSAVEQSSLHIIRRNVRALVRLINQLIDLTHVAKGMVQLELDTVDAHEIIRFALQNLEAQEKSKALRIDQHLEAKDSLIEADAGKIEQVLSNLIGNAFKFATEGGKVSVVTRNEPGKLVIEVSDNGIGISPEAMGRIFCPFEQQDRSIYPRFGGLGLGLSIAQSFVKAHRGTLEAVSEGVDKGAKFTVRFDLSPPLAGAPNEKDSLVLKEESQLAGRA